jgi:biopolymer transport protein ExbB
MKTTFAKRIKNLSIFCLTALAIMPGLSHAWWNADWDTRKKLMLNTAQVATKEPLVQVPVLVRLHTGNFDFGNVKDNGGDIRFVAEDDKTPLKYHIEKFDAVNEMVMVWVQVPKLTPGKAETIWMYYGNSKATPADDVKATFDANQVAVYHFDAAEGLPQDRSGKGNNATQSGAKMGEGSLIGRGATFDGNGVITVPASPTLKLVAAQGLTVSAWIKIPSATASLAASSPVSASAPAQAVAAPVSPVLTNAILFQQLEGAKTITLGIAAGKLYAAVDAAETPKTADVTPGMWHHVAMTVGQVLTVYLDGKVVAQAPVTLADMQGDITLGKGYVGEMDELLISSVARSADWIQVQAGSQGADALLVGYGQDEANGGGGTSYFGTILHSVTTDGWVVIGLLAVMAVISFAVMFLKAIVISKVKRGNKAFLRDYNKLSVTETAKLDQDESAEDAEIENSQLLIALYGKHDHYQDSTLYRIYHTGMQEIKNRFVNVEASQQYLSPQAIGSIKASLDATLVRENQKLSSLMVLLTIAISGGPFLGLLGTVVGVMITFAAIAATGDVNVAAIAPGIAAALVATVAGLAVAIPALFGYNYLGSLIKNTSADMHIFVDEYISRITESYSR